MRHLLENSYFMYFLPQPTKKFNSNSSLVQCTLNVHSRDRVIPETLKMLLTASLCDTPHMNEFELSK